MKQVRQELAMTLRAGLLGLVFAGLASTSALAETLTVTEIKGPAGGPVSFVIPSLVATDANLSEADIRALFTQDFGKTADALIGLDAASITIPEIRFTFAGTEGEKSPSEMVVRDVALGPTEQGAINGFEIGGASITGGGSEITLGRLTVAYFDIGSLLRYYGFGERQASSEFRTVYSDLIFEGASLTSPEASCELGRMTVPESRVRPTKVSALEIMALAEKMDAGAPPSNTDLGTFVAYYADVLQSSESSPQTIGSFSCQGKDDKGENFAVSAGELIIGSMSGGVIGPSSISNVEFGGAQDGWLRLGSFTLKSIDLNPTIAALESAGPSVGLTWFTENYRRLIPSFEGLSFSAFAMDIPDEKNVGQRIRAEVAEFDTTLGAYLNGVPTSVATTASGIRVPLPPGEETKQLRDFGFTEIRADYNFAARWDSEAETILIDTLSATVVDMGSFAVSGTIGNAVAALFSPDIDVAKLAAMAVTLKDLRIDLDDAGLGTLAVEAAAKEQGKSVEELRAAMSGVAQGTILISLGGTAQAKAVADAVGAVINGTPHLTVSITANDERGIGLVDMMSAQSDPTALLQKLTIEAEASGEIPPATDDAEQPETESMSGEDAETESEGGKVTLSW